MNTYSQVANDINNWKSMGLSKAEIVVKSAEDCLGWPYVWGGYGQKCTSSNRESYAKRSSCPAAEAKVIRSQCQILNGSKSSCSGCQWYPGGCTLFFDCRGFTRWLLQQVGISLQGGGATSQWNTASNWVQKGPISEMPMDKVCCVFMKSGDKMSHTGMHIGGGNIIHCSGTVKRGKTTDRGWTHYAIPVGMEGDVPVPTPTTDKPTLRIGSSGPYVVECQQDLLKLGYDLSPYGADGKYGKLTSTRIKEFQQSQGLKADGICGPMTWGALDQAVGPEPSETLYTVTIRHLTKDQADTLKAQYANAEVNKE